MSKTPDKPKNVRITVDLSSAGYARLEAIESATGAGSKAEVVRRALQLYEYVTTRSRAGAELCVLEEDGTKTVLLLLEALEQR